MLLEESKGIGVVQTKTLRHTGKLGNENAKLELQVY